MSGPVMVYCGAMVTMNVRRYFRREHHWHDGKIIVIWPAMDDYELGHCGLAFVGGERRRTIAAPSRGQARTRTFSRLSLKSISIDNALPFNASPLPNVALSNRPMSWSSALRTLRS